MGLIRVTWVLAVIIATLPVLRASAMDIEATDGELYSLHLKGEIIDGDYKRFVQTIREKQSFPFSVFISSPGGDVIEAVRIGNFIREALLSTYAVEECISACVLIWVAGVEREATALFGLHRPVYDKSYFAGLSSSDASKKYSELDEFIRTYLSDMNIRTTVIDRIMSTKSSDVDLVSSEELLEMVGHKSPAHEEWIIAKCGELSNSEQRDFAATITIAMVEELTKKLGTDEEQDFYRELIEQKQDQLKYALSLSPGYRDYLTNKMKGISKCKEKAVGSVREKLISNE